MDYLYIAQTRIKIEDCDSTRTAAPFWDINSTSVDKYSLGDLQPTANFSNQTNVCQIYI